MRHDINAIFRKAVLDFCKELLNADEVSLTLTPVVLQCLTSVITASEERINQVASIIADIQQPMSVDEQVLDPEHLHQIKVKVSIHWCAKESWVKQLHRICRHHISNTNTPTMTVLC